MARRPSGRLSSAPGAGRTSPLHLRPSYHVHLRRDREQSSWFFAELVKVWWSPRSLQNERKHMATTWIQLDNNTNESEALAGVLQDLAAALLDRLS